MISLLDYINCKGDEILLYDDNHKPKGYFLIKDIDFDITLVTTINTTLGTLTCPVDQLVATTEGDILAKNLRRRDQLIHPLGFRPIVIGNVKKFKHVVMKFNLDEDGYMQYENALVRIK